MQPNYLSAYPSFADLKAKARRNIPRFAFEYLEGGCNEDVNLHKNTSDLRRIELEPRYLGTHVPANLQTELFGHTYDAPFGIAPVGLQGLIWPNAPEILAKAAFKQNVPFILSTVSTSSIERIAELTEGRAWFQLYHPAKENVRFDLIKRAGEANCPVLVILSDVPVFGFRPRDIRNGLAMPPSMSLRNILQIMGKPEWALRTLIHGQPSFKSLTPYTPKGLSMKQLGAFMNETFSGRLNAERIAVIRDQWKGKLVVKGISSVEDAAQAIKLGVDGIIVSNHGGRQLDAGESSINSLKAIADVCKGQTKLMMDSGIESGVDVARALAVGAEFAFMGRAFMYGVAALGDKGGDHTIGMLKTQLWQVLEQVCCAKPSELDKHLL